MKFSCARTTAMSVPVILTGKLSIHPFSKRTMSLSESCHYWAWVEYNLGISPILHRPDRDITSLSHLGTIKSRKRTYHTCTGRTCKLHTERTCPGFEPVPYCCEARLLTTTVQPFCKLDYFTVCVPPVSKKVMAFLFWTSVMDIQFELFILRKTRASCCFGSY